MAIVKRLMPRSGRSWHKALTPALRSKRRIDEIEIYPQVGLVLNRGGLELVSEGGTLVPENFARSATATPYADGVIVGFLAHSIAHLNDGQYGWGGGGRLQRLFRCPAGDVNGDGRADLIGALCRYRQICHKYSIAQ